MAQELTVLKEVDLLKRKQYQNQNILKRAKRSKIMLIFPNAYIQSIGMGYTKSLWRI